jgi:hypothetical protein
MYDTEEVRRNLDEWAQQVFATSQTTTTETIAEQSHATTAFSIHWKHAEDAGRARRGTAPPAAARSSTSVDVTTVALSLRKQFGPLFCVSSYDPKACTLGVYVLPIPTEAIGPIQKRIMAVHAMLAASANRSFGFHVSMLGVAIGALAISVLLLHNHWYGYQEPWETPLEFIRYHLPFQNSQNHHEHPEAAANELYQ